MNESLLLDARGRNPGGPRTPKHDRRERRRLTAARRRNRPSARRCSKRLPSSNHRTCHDKCFLAVCLRAVVLQAKLGLRANRAHFERLRHQPIQVRARPVARAALRAHLRLVQSAASPRLALPRAEPQATRGAAAPKPRRARGAPPEAPAGAPPEAPPHPYSHRRLIPSLSLASAPSHFFARRLQVHTYTYVCARACSRRRRRSPGPTPPGRPRPNQPVWVGYRRGGGAVAPRMHALPTPYPNLRLSHSRALRR